MRWDDEEPPQPPADQPTGDDVPTQRLTVQFLLAWVTGTSILLGLYMAGPGQLKQEQFAMLVGLGVVRFLASILYGAALASWWLVATGWYRGAIRYPQWAGHWLCLIISLKELVMLVAAVFLFAVLSIFVDASQSTEPTNRPAAATLVFVPAVAAILAMGGWLVFLIWPGQPIRWKIYGGIRIATEGCGAVGALFLTYLIALEVNEVSSFMLVYPLIAMTGFGCGIAAFVAAFVAMIVDIAYGEKRDWLHWLGVSIALTSPLLGMLLWYGAVMGQSMKAFDHV